MGSVCRIARTTFGPELLLAAANSARSKDDDTPVARSDRAITCGDPRSETRPEVSPPVYPGSWVHTSGANYDRRHSICQRGRRNAFAVRLLRPVKAGSLNRPLS